MSNSLLTVKDVAERLKISTSTVYRLCKRGLPHIHKTFGIRVQERELDKWTNQDRSIHILAENILQNALTKIPPIDIDRTKGGIEVARKKTRHNYGYGSVYIRKTKTGIPRFYVDYYDRGGDFTWSYPTKLLILRQVPDCFGFSNSNNPDNVSLWEQHAIQLEFPCP